MDERTRNEFIMQMHKTQKEFDKLKDIIVAGSPDNGIPEVQTEFVDSVPVPKAPEGKGFPITCSVCGKPDTVPFQPQYQSKLFCKDCYRKGER